jgi:hypothetical protein
MKKMPTLRKIKRAPLALVPPRPRAHPSCQPLGVVGIIVPWNYPLFLAISPLAAALAAGNRVMVKMSEFTPRTGELLAEPGDAKYFRRRGCQRWCSAMPRSAQISPGCPSTTCCSPARPRSATASCAWPRTT